MTWLSDSDRHAVGELVRAVATAGELPERREAVTGRLGELVGADETGWDRTPQACYGAAVEVRDGSVVALAWLGRDERTFSLREREMMALASPGLSAAMDQGRARERMSQPRAGVATVVLDRSGEIEHCGPEAARWLLEHFGAPGHPGWLPAAVADWLSLPPRPPLVSVLGARRLEIHLLAGDPPVLLLEETVRRFERSALRRLGLNHRECEVLGAAAHGAGTELSGPDEGYVADERWIADELFLSTHAVREALAHAELRLAVPSRNAAVVRALRESL